MDYEHQPTRGPGLWVGAGALTAIGGVALVWVTRDDAVRWTLAIAGWALFGIGVVTTMAGLWWAARHRR